MSSILCPWSYYCPRSRGTTQSGPDDNLWPSTSAEFDSCQISPSAAWDEQQGWDGAGGGCNPGPPRPYDLGWNWSVCGWTSADNEGSCWRHRTLGRYLSPSSLCPSWLPRPHRRFASNSNSLNLPGVSGQGLWLCSESMIWWGKWKNEVTEAMRWCISTAQLRALRCHQTLGRQAMNGAEGLRSTFGFMDTKGKPNELGFCFSIFVEKPTFFSDLLHQVWCPPPLDAQWVILIIKRQHHQNQGLIGAWADPCRPHPQGRRGTHPSPSAENSRAPHVWFLCCHTPFLLLKTKHLPMFSPRFLTMGRSINSQDIPWARGLIKIRNWRPLPSGGWKGIYDFWAGKPVEECESCKNILFFEILGLGVPGNQRNYFSGSKNAILFFWTSVCFSVTWGEQNLPGLLKHRRCGREALGNEVPFLKLGSLTEAVYWEPGAPRLLSCCPARPAGPCHPRAPILRSAHRDTKRHFHRRPIP